MKTCETLSRGLAPLSMAVAITTALWATTGSANNNGIDPRIRPDVQLSVTSSSADLNESIAESINYVYDSLVVGPQQYPTTEVEDRITRFERAGYPAIPSLWGSYHGKPHPNAQGYRENFCLRDIAHQTEGAAMLSLNEENYTMLTQFASDALKDKRIDVNAGNFDVNDPEASAKTKSFWQKYWTLWSYNFYGFPYYMDAGFQELPAPFELLEKVYTMYEYTGDPRWISDTFMDYGRMLHTQFSEVYDFNGNGIVDNRGNEGILPTLWEFEGASHISEDELVYDMSTSPYTLTIKKEYFERLGVQDLALKVRFRNGKDDYLYVRVNNLVGGNGKAPLLSNDYIEVNTRYEINDAPVTFNVPSGVTLQSVSDGTEPLIEGTHYTRSGNVVTIKASYLNDIKNNKSANIKSSFGFSFSDGSKDSVVVELAHRNFVPRFDKNNVVLDWNNLQDITLKVDLSGTPGNHDLYRIENGMNRVAEAGDTLGVQYQSLLAMEGMLRAKATLKPAQAVALNAEADTYKTKAADLLRKFQTEWYNDETGTYARAFDGYGNAIYGWGHENSFFMPMKELLEPGEKADNYLQFIHDSATAKRLNEEAITYLPEAFYNYGKNEEAWFWMQEGLKRFYSDRTEEQKERTYPEIAFTNVSNVVSYMMGYKPLAYKKTVESLSRLTSDLDYIQADNLPIGQSFVDVIDYDRSIDSLVSLKHEGTHTSTFSNSSTSADTITWKAQFAGQHDYLYVDGVRMNATSGNINGVQVSYVEVQVNAGESKTASTVAPAGSVELSSLEPVSSSTDWGQIKQNTSVDGNPLKIGEVVYSTGLGTHANSEIVYNLNGQYKTFKAIVGVDDEVGPNGSIAFSVYLDGQLAYESGVLNGTQSGQTVNLDVSGATTMKLVASDGGDGISNDHADWADAYLSR